MNRSVHAKFIEDINQNLGIVHKVANIYFLNSWDRNDVIQEMLYQLWKSYPGFRGNAKFSTWMYRVCLNTAITYLSQAKRNHHLSLTYQYTEIADAENETQGDAMVMLNKAIENLTQINKAIILLYLEALSYDEIAQITGLSKSNISVRLVRIRKELEKELKKSIK